MKTSICHLLSLSLLLGLLPGCTKSDDGPTPPHEKEFKEVGIPMEYYAPYDDEKTGGYYNFFTFQNDSSFPMYTGFRTIYSSEVRFYYLLPGEQATRVILMEYAPGLTMSDLRIEDLQNRMMRVEFYFNAPAPGKFDQIVGAPEGWIRGLDKNLDTCGVYLFSEKIQSNTPTPSDQSQWKYTHYNDHRIRWTYRVTNADHGVAVRQTLERWAQKDDQE